MRIENISIQNFRCFKKYEVAFAEKTTVFIGKNGTGKTNLISALKKGMSFIFAKSKAYNSLGESNDCRIASFDLMDTTFDNREFRFPTILKYKGVHNEKDLNWEFRKTQDPGRIHATPYQQALDIALTAFNDDSTNSQWPVLAFFSDSYPHVKITIGKKAATILKMDTLPRTFGYYAWDEESNCAEFWQIRYVKARNSLRDIEDEIEYLKKDPTDQSNLLEKLSKKTEELRQEINFIDTQIKTFSKPLRDEYSFINEEFTINRVSVNRPDKTQSLIQFSFENGREMFFEILPQGYKRLISIVFDIAYRSFILNGAKEPTGIVFIDEVELHLHPTLQQEVLARLRKTFPKIQFIVSTHSPLVISNLEYDNGKNKVIKLLNNGIEYSNTLVENIYGIDYITSLSDIMDSDFRPSSIDKLIDSYVILKKRGKTDASDRIYSELMNIVGSDNSRIKEEIRLKLSSLQ